MVGDQTDLQGHPWGGTQDGQGCWSLRTLRTFEAMVALAEKKGLTKSRASGAGSGVRILQASDWDATLKAPKLWECPVKEGQVCELPEANKEEGE